MNNSTPVTDFVIDTYARLIDVTSCWDDDVAFETLMAFDPDGTIYNAWVARNARREDSRRASLTVEQRAAEDAESERFAQHGRVIMRQVIARHSPAV